MPNAKAAIYNTQMNGHGYVPIKLCKNRYWQNLVCRLYSADSCSRGMGRVQYPFTDTIGARDEVMCLRFHSHLPRKD